MIIALRGENAMLVSEMNRDEKLPKLESSASFLWPELKWGLFCFKGVDIKGSSCPYLNHLVGVQGISVRTDPPNSLMPNWLTRSAKKKHFLPLTVRLHGDARAKCARSFGDRRQKHLRGELCHPERLSGGYISRGNGTKICREFSKLRYTQLL